MKEDGAIVEMDEREKDTQVNLQPSWFLQKVFFHNILPEDPQQDQPEPPLYCHIRFTLLHRSINWQLDVIIGCFMFPFINRLSQLNLNLLPLPPTSSPMSLSSVEQSIMARDLVAMALYAVVVSICALENFNVQRMLPLVFLGVVLGLIFARSRNLLPSMLLHSLWNGFVFMELMR